jgi:hypothetical protein
MLEMLLAEDTERFAGRMMVLVQAVWMIGFLVFQMVSLVGTLAGRIDSLIRCLWPAQPEVIVEEAPGKTLPCPRCGCRCRPPTGWTWADLADDGKAACCGRCRCRVRVRRR